VKELDAIDNEEFVAAIEAHAVEVEKALVRIFSSEEPQVLEQYGQLRMRFLNGSSAPIPTFDFELN
jgi:hypothetical protein